MARFVCAVTAQARAELAVERRTLNGRSAAVLLRGGQPFAALQLGAGEGRVQPVWFRADPAKLAVARP